jgi:hypothetical protein
MDPISFVVLMAVIGMAIWLVITLNAIRADVEKMSAHVEQLTTKNHDEALYTIRKAVLDLKDKDNPRPDGDSSGTPV